MTASDPALADFVALGDPATRRRVERDGGYFVVEGVLAIERLLALPRWPIRTIALLPRIAERLAPALERDLAGRPGPPPRVEVVDEATLRGVVGFDLHRGALASVERLPIPPAIDVLPPDGLVVAVEGVNDHENLGALFRNAAAFGAGAVLLDPACADPFYRRSVRVSLGHVLAVPIGRLDPLPAGLDGLHAAGATTVALTPHAGATVADLATGSATDRPRPGPVVLLVGAEGPGLTDASLAAADRRAAIPMAAGVDSLNVATAAAVALSHLRG